MKRYVCVRAESVQINIVVHIIIIIIRRQTISVSVVFDLLYMKENMPNFQLSQKRLYTQFGLRAHAQFMWWPQKRIERDNIFSPKPHLKLCCTTTTHLIYIHSYTNILYIYNNIHTNTLVHLRRIHLQSGILIHILYIYM